MTTRSQGRITVAAAPIPHVAHLVPVLGRAALVLAVFGTLLASVGIAGFLTGPAGMPAPHWVAATPFAGAMGADDRLIAGLARAR